VPLSGDRIDWFAKGKDEVTVKPGKPLDDG
jgi:hypothetical protein